MNRGMMSNPTYNLLDEAIRFNEDNHHDVVYSAGSGKMLLIEDCVETSGAFVLHHLIKRSLSPNRSSDVVVFLSFAHPFSHYDRILRKMVVLLQFLCFSLIIFLRKFFLFFLGWPERLLL